MQMGNKISEKSKRRAFTVKVEIIEKADARAHNFDFKWQFNRSDLFQAQSLIFNISPVIIGNSLRNEVTDW